MTNFPQQPESPNEASRPPWMGPPSRWDDLAVRVDRDYLRVEARARQAGRWFDRIGALILALLVLGYVILFTGMNARHDRAVQQGAARKEALVRAASSGHATRFREAMQTFGAVQAHRVPVTPSFSEPAQWFAWTEPNREPLHAWAKAFLADCSHAALRCAERCLDPEEFCARIDLRDAGLRGADLSSVDLREADLSRTDARAADLRDSDLRDARLDGADLRGADLRGARGVTCEALTRSRTDDGTKVDVAC